MQQLNATILTTQRSANAETGVVAVGTQSSFNLQGNLDNNKTIRSNPTVGDISIAHSPTKEFGGKGIRHVFRVDLKANGNLPASYAYIVLGNQDSPIGVERAMEAAKLLISSLIYLCDQPNSAEHLPVALMNHGSGFPQLMNEGPSEEPSDVGEFLLSTISRVLAGEG